MRKAEMDYTPGPEERREILIREMARQASRRSKSSDDEQQHDASVEQVTESQIIPAVAGPQDDQVSVSQETYKIYPSRFKRPSQPPPASVSDEDSIEFGRGYSTRRPKHPSLRLEDPDDASQSMSLTMDGEKFTVTGTPPFVPTTHPRKAVATRQPKAPKLNSSAKPSSLSTSRFDLGSRRKASVQKNGAVLHDDTFPPSQQASAEEKNNDRPGLVSLPRRAANQKAARSREHEQHDFDLQDLDESLRIGRRHSGAMDRLAKSQKSSLPPPRGLVDPSLSIGDVHVQEEQQASIQRQPHAPSAHESSFVLPNLHNITELVSGVRNDGTPLFTRSVKSRSRFTTPSKSRSHAAIAAVPIPTDERALYAALQLLHDKVANLEGDKDQLEQRAEAYELEVLQLRSRVEEQEQRDHSDSGLGYEPDEEQAQAWAKEKAHFQRCIKTLEKRLACATEKIQQGESTIKSVAVDREQVSARLAEAQLGSEDLKNETLAVTQEILRVKSELDRVNRTWQKRLHKLTTRESELQAKIARRDKAITEMASLSKELWSLRNTSSAARPAATSANTIFKPSQSDTARRQQQRPPSSRAAKAQVINEFTNEAVENSTTDLHLPLPRTTKQGLGGMPQEFTKEDDFMSFMDGDEVAKLRQVVEQEKAALHSAANLTQKTTTLPRKSSMKKRSRFDDDNATHNSTRNITREPTVTIDHPKSRRASQADANASQEATELTDIQQTAQSFEFTRQSEKSAASERNERRGAHRTRSHGADLTSSIILPDITLSGAALDLSAKSAAIKSTSKVQRPVPVTDRHLPSVTGEFDQTIRPARSPGVALATVIKSIEDELAVLRTQFAQREALYYQHDSSLSRRRRKLVLARMQKLLVIIDQRCDQIYNLYDVLEGQKAAGQLMTEAEVDETLKSVGLEADQILQRNAQGSTTGVNPGKTTASFADDEIDDSASEHNETDDELPWEGFGDSQTHSQLHNATSSVQI